MTIPNTNDGAMEMDGAIVPISQPVGYTPAPGDIGAVFRGAFYPLEPLTYRGENSRDSAPKLVGTVQSDWQYPQSPQYGAAVANPDVYPCDVNGDWVARPGYYSTYVYPRPRFGVKLMDSVLDVDETAENKADPNYVANTGIQTMSTTHLDFPTEHTVSATNDSGKLLLSYTLPAYTMVRFSTTGTLPGGLKVDTNYWCDGSGHVAKTMKKVSTGDVVMYASAGSGTNKMLEYKCDKDDGVAYLWTYGDAMIEFRVKYIDRFTWRLFIRSKVSTDTILYLLANTGTPTTPYPAEGILFTTRSTTRIYAKLSGTGAIYEFSGNSPGKSSVNNKCWGKAPESNVNYGFDYSGGYITGKRPHPVLRTGQTMYSFTDNTVKEGTDYTGLPFNPTIGKVSGVLRVTGYKRGMILSAAAENVQTPTYGWMDSSWASSYWDVNAQLYNSIPVVAKIGKMTASWSAGALTLTSPTTDTVIRYRKASDPTITAQTTVYAGTSCYLTTGTTNPGLADGNIIILTGTVPLPLFASLSTDQQCAFIVRDYTAVTVGPTTNYYFNLASISGGSANAPTVAGSFGFMRTYSAPISIAASDTVTYYATKGCMESSDEFTTVITYDGVTPPADFTQNKWSALPMQESIDNNTKNAVIEFQRKADWYVSPTGTGDGTTPATPGKLEDICGYGDSTSATYYDAIWGSARGTISVALTRLTTGYTTLSVSGDTPWSRTLGNQYKTYYGENVAPNTQYTTQIRPTNTCQLQFVVRKQDGTTDITPIFKQTVVGVSDAITATWVLATKTLTFTGIPDFVGLDLLCDSLALPTTVITRTAGTASMVLSTTSALKVRLCYENNAMLVATDVGTITNIDPDNTANFIQNFTMTWTANIGGNATENFTKRADVIWCTEGTYNIGVANRHYWVKSDCVLRGGYSSDFRQRDTTNRKSIIVGNAMTAGTAGFYANITQIPDSNANSGGQPIDTGIIDGFWGEWADATAATSCILFYASRINNCHVDQTITGMGSAVSVTVEAFKIGATVNTRWSYFKPLGYSVNMFAGGAVAKATYCTCNLDISRAGGEGNLTVYVFNDPNYRYNSADHCDVTVNAVGGTGHDATYVYDYYNRDAVCNVTVCGVGDYCNIDVTAVAGRGGNSWSGGENQSGGQGGNSTCTIAIGTAPGGASTGRIMNNTTINASSTSGTGGNGGNAGEWTNHSLPEPTGGAGGSSFAYCYSENSNRGTTYSGWSCPGPVNRTETLSAIGGNGGAHGSGTPYGGTYEQTLSAYVATPTGVEPAYRLIGTYYAESGSVSTGHGGNSSSFAQIQNPVLGYMPEITATCVAGTAPRRGGYVTEYVLPCYIDPDLLDYTEIAPNYATNFNGNAKRVNGIGNVFATGWYSGTINGDGAPLDGYETPQGTGIARGDYWE